MTSLSSETRRRTSYRDLEALICNLNCMAKLAGLAREVDGADGAEMVAFSLDKLEEMSSDLRLLYYAGFGEGGPCA